MNNWFAMLLDDENMSSFTANAVSIIIKSRDATPFDNILVYNIQIFFDQMTDEHLSRFGIVLCTTFK